MAITNHIQTITQSMFKRNIQRQIALNNSLYEKFSESCTRPTSTRIAWLSTQFTSVRTRRTIRAVLTSFVILRSNASLTNPLWIRLSSQTQSGCRLDTRSHNLGSNLMRFRNNLVPLRRQENLLMTSKSKLPTLKAKLRLSRLRNAIHSNKEMMFSLPSEILLQMVSQSPMMKTRMLFVPHGTDKSS